MRGSGGEKVKEEMTNMLRKWKEDSLGEKRGPESNEEGESPRMHANQNLI